MTFSIHLHILRVVLGRKVSSADVGDIPTTTISSITEQQDAGLSDDDAIHDMATSELEDDEDAPGEEEVEEDADFDEETPPPEQRRESSSSAGSLRPGKRKAESQLDDEEYMKQNPELYGLRRSVCSFLEHAFAIPVTNLLPPQGRARPSRRVVRAYIYLPTSNSNSLTCARSQVDSSDEDDDEDEVNSGRRRKRQKTSGARPGMSPFT